MEIIADLQLHSRYSRAVSDKMTLSEVSRWSKRKGVTLVATGDWTHPLWFYSIKNELKESAAGIYTLKERPNETKFLLSTEISSIYTQGGKVRRVHNLIFSPSLETSEKIIKKLHNEGANLSSDGRPIVGISSKDLLEMVLEIDERVLFIPAHAWTPWFAIFGSKSGFDSLKDAFGGLEKYIYAVETGLSSDPLMNWQIKELESRSIVSFSDAHSAPKIGREATVFTSSGAFDYSFDDIASAIKRNPFSKLKIGYTIEFFPEEGKYHWSGHRTCNVRYSAEEVREKGVTCPVCSKPLTIGVENRVMDLSYKTIHQDDLILEKNEVGLTYVYDPEKKKVPFVSMIPLLEILYEVVGRSKTKSEREYDRITQIHSEFDILLKLGYDKIQSLGGQKLTEAVRRVRERRAIVDPGYDGVYGKVKIFEEKDEKTKIEDKNQQPLF
jgi:uncharacterized protein (TIGR00375 family)